MTAALASNVTSLPRGRPLPAMACSRERRGDGWSLVPVHTLRTSPMGRRAILALRDPLTGLPNRTALTFIIDELIKCDRHGSVILLGLDGFKRLNEVAGHRIGDQLLVEVAAILCEQIEGNGGICRYGGSEFAIILPELTSRSEVGRTARRVCRYIDEGSKLANATSVRARTGAAIFPGGRTGTIGTAAMCRHCAPDGHAAAAIRHSLLPPFDEGKRAERSQIGTCATLPCDCSQARGFLPAQA